MDEASHKKASGRYQCQMRLAATLWFYLCRGHFDMEIFYVCPHALRMAAPLVTNSHGLPGADLSLPVAPCGRGSVSN